MEPLSPATADDIADMVMSMGNNYFISLSRVSRHAALQLHFPHLAVRIHEGASNVRIEQVYNVRHTVTLYMRKYECPWQIETHLLIPRMSRAFWGCGKLTAA
jgi:hypothetical protein